MFQKPNEPLEFPALSWVQLVREQPHLQPGHRPHCQSKYCLNRDVSKMFQRCFVKSVFRTKTIPILFWPCLYTAHNAVSYSPPIPYPLPPSPEVLCFSSQ